MTDQSKYEIVAGLEVHAQLLTASKLFCGDSTNFGDPPNTHISPITLAYPGTLPKMNSQAIAFAISIGLACKSEIVRKNYFARKNYFYPDLPKGYQVSQHTTPVCKGGNISITIEGLQKNIRLNRIHLEEDAGKSLHDMYPGHTAIDFNRAGIPLIEIVTEPDIRSGDEAYVFLTELRRLVRYLGICDGNMEQGSMRCDANISVRKRGDTVLGTKVEVKNLNSIRNVKRAIEAEAIRLMELIENGEPVMQQTRSYDAAANTTFAIRDKEDADDYRYFADPDLTPFDITDAFIQSVQSAIPALQAERIVKYQQQYGLSEYDAMALTDEKKFSDYFEQVVNFLAPGADRKKSSKAAANWMLGPVKSWLNEKNADITRFPVTPEQLASVILLTETGKLSFTAATTKLLRLVIDHPGTEPLALAEKHQLLQQSDMDYIQPLVDAVILQLDDKVKEYKKGKKGLMGLFVGEVMKRSGGKADPKMVNEILLEKLKS